MMKAPVMAATWASCPTSSSRRSVNAHRATIGRQHRLSMMMERCSQAPTAA